MIIETIQFLIAWGIILFIVGFFLYKTYQAIRNEPAKPHASPWKQVSAKVLAARVTEQFRHGTDGLSVDLEYTVDGTRYTGTGETVMYRGDAPPTSVELVYKPESPEAWEWLDDHSELTENPSNNRFVIFFIWLMLILVGIGVAVAVYFPELLG